jgi:superfamily II DNA or RNA helicase
VPKYLTIGGTTDPLLPKIKSAILKAKKIEIAVAFIKSSGLELIFPALEEAVTERGASLCVLTSDYLDVTNPQALRQLMLLAERGADVRLFATTGNQSFHLKAYIFTSTGAGNTQSGSAFIGSSNISKPALTDGIEWNYLVPLSGDSASEDQARFTEIRTEFRNLFDHSQVMALQHDWITSYEARRKTDRLPMAPGSNDPELPPPTPNDVQCEALEALADTRASGFQRGLVVMATGLGKTYLAAFDAESCRATKVLFVAHREEILFQAEKTFLRIHPKARVGQYTGSAKDTDADMIFASVQTLGKATHLGQFAPNNFDYIVVDEFHHAAAPTYKKLLTHFQPRFLLGLTATPERTDQSDILTLCDNNLVYDRNLLYGVENGFLCPFTYFGIYDSTVDYQEIPWRNGRFDPESLSNKLATLNRARHALEQWKEKAQSTTLAFCVSIKHATFMAQYFNRFGIKAAAVYGGSEVSREAALDQLGAGQLQVVFSVELFNEGVDLPAIDTVLMLRPTESKILFLQQLGRGLRTHPGKERLVILDFIGNHKGFLNKPQALMGVPGIPRELAKFGQDAKDQKLDLPPGCFVNYDLEIIEFLINLAGEGPSQEYLALKDSMGRRPTLAEFYRSGASVSKVRSQYGQWFNFVKEEGDLSEEESLAVDFYQGFLLELEKTAMTRSFKMVLIESLLENDGFNQPLSLSQLAHQARAVFRRRRRFVNDLHKDHQDVDGELLEKGLKKWEKYWKDNPINAWIGGNQRSDAPRWFKVENGLFDTNFAIEPGLMDEFQMMVQEIVDYRLAQYEPRIVGGEWDSNSTPAAKTQVEIPFFESLQIACGSFREGSISTDSFKRLGVQYGQLDPSRHFIARASGNSMDGGDKPVKDGDYLLLERLERGSLSDNSGATLVVERKEPGSVGEFILRDAVKGPSGEVVLKAKNQNYGDLLAQDGMRSPARLKAVVDELDMRVGEFFMREDIPPLFGHEFNPGNWNSGHVVLNDQKVHVLLVTLNKQGKAQEHRYRDYFDEDDEGRFHWQSQNSTSPESKKGAELIGHEEFGISVYLFVRANKLEGNKAAPFKFYGEVRYLGHEGSRPMSVVLGL